MELFVNEPSLTFEPPPGMAKKAATQLDEDPQRWARQVLTELFRQVPDSSEYTPRVMFTKVDEEQGFGLGVVVITNSTDSALSTVRPMNVGKRVFIPVVVKNHLLCPLDILMTTSGKMMPLNGHRLRQALFRPEIFEKVTDDWGDTTLYNMFYPPGRSDNDFGAGISQGAGGGTQGAVTMIQGPGMKLSGLKYAFLEELLPTLLATDLHRLGRTVENTPGLLKQAGMNEVFLGAMRKLASAEATAVSDARPMLEAALDAATPHVVQMGYSDIHDTYWVKVASRDAFYHKNPICMDRGEFLKFSSPEIVQKVDTDGTVTVSATDQDASGMDVDTSKWGVVEEPGIYKVKSVHGKELTGWVLPTLIDLDGTKVPMAVFTNGVAAQVQDQICGARVGDGVDLPSAPAKGTGCFYCAGQGGIAVTVPVNVVGAEADMNGGDVFLVHSLTGEEAKVRLVPGLKKLVASGGEFLMPDTAKFLPLDKEVMVSLCSKPDEMSKTSSDRLEPKVTLFAGEPGELSMRFHQMPKLASQFPQRQDAETAVFALCLAGLDAQSAINKVAQAGRGEVVEIQGLADVVLAQDLLNESRKVASVRSQEVTGLRRYVVKEASLLPDAMTVDAVLSLGFINSENVRMFVSRLPYLEKALGHVCELLLASRIGLTELPEFAAARAVRALDDVIQGLRALSLREVQEGGFRAR